MSLYAIALFSSSSRFSEKENIMAMLRAGLILDDSDQSFFDWDLVSKAKLSHLYSIEALIVQRAFRDTQESTIVKLFISLKRHGFRRLVAKVLFAILTKIEGFIVLRNAKYKEFFSRYSLDQFEIRKIFVNPEISPSGLVYRYSKDDLDKIIDLKLDLLIRGGSGILRGDILSVCRFGIVSFHHANTDVNRGGPPGFWEVFNREPSTGFIIQRLLNEVDGGDVLFKGNIATSFPYMLNLCKLYFKSNSFLHKLIERIAKDGKLPQTQPKVPYAYSLYETPTISYSMSYLINSFAYGLTKLFGRLLGKSHRWGVAYQFVEDWKSSVLWKSTVIKNPPNRYLADPFVKVRDGRVIAFVEDYDYSKSRGKISAYELFDNGYKELGTALEESFHLSYPFLFEANNSLYMCPETHESNDIRIYRCLDFPLSWELYKVLIKNVSAADTNIFNHNGKYWMLTNIDSSSLGDHSSELHIFYADAFDSDDWIPHPNNPVVFDCLRARNGGLIVDGSDIYRVFQVQGFDMYGEAMGVAKITKLSVDYYCEEPVFNIPPKFFKDIKGTHTLSYDSGVLLLDFVKLESYRN
jgi:hypothetical protein